MNYTHLKYKWLLNYNWLIEFYEHPYVTKVDFDLMVLLKMS